MKRRSRTQPAFSGSGEASAAADRKGKDGGKQRQRSGGAASSASSGDEISASRSVSSGEEATGRTRRPRKKERRRWDLPMRYVMSSEESSVGVGKPQHRAPGISIVNLNPTAWKKKGKHEAQQSKSSTVKSTPKEKRSTSHSTEGNAEEEESSSSHPKIFRSIYPIGKIYTGDVEVSSGIAQRPNQEQQVKHFGGSSDQPASNSEGDEHVAAEAPAAPLSEVVGDDSTGDILKDGCLDDVKLLSRSGSVEAQEQASCDEETSTLLRGEDKKKKEPKPSSGELGKIAQDGDEHSSKRTSYEDLRKMIAPDEDEQHPDKIGLPAIKDLKQEKEGAGWRALLDIDDDTVSEKTLYYLAKLISDHPDDDCDYLPPYEPHQLTEVYEQLALYRIRGYQVSVDQQLAELDDENLKKHYSSSDLFDEGYFEYYEESLEWYFDPELCKRPGYDDYQRLVLYNHGEFLDWDNYRSTLNTYEKDLAYVQYCEALANETKWIEDYLAHSTHQWDRVENMAHLQALQIATDFANVSPILVDFAFEEYIWGILFDHSNYRDMDGVYFEIWKRVAKLKKGFREALLEIHSQNMFPLRAIEIEHELEDKRVRVFYMKDDYDAYVAGIDEMASDDEARRDIGEAVKKMIPKQMNYLDYIQKKIDIAKDIGLIGKAPTQLTGDDSQGTLPEDN